jgi:hypothetical protein
MTGVGGVTHLKECVRVFGIGIKFRRFYRLRKAPRRFVTHLEGLFPQMRLILIGRTGREVLRQLQDSAEVGGFGVNVLKGKSEFAVIEVSWAQRSGGRIAG